MPPPPPRHLLDRRISVHEAQGPGPGVLLLHSSGLSGRQWRPLMAALGRAAWAPSLLGYDGSEPLDLAAGPGALASDLAVSESVLLRASDARAEPLDVVGHSYGGMLALLLAARHPDRVRRMVLHEPVCWGVLFSDGSPEIRARTVAFLESGFLDPAGGGSAAWLETFVDYWSGPGAWAQMPPAHRQSFLALGPKIFAEVSDLCRDRTPLSAYQHLDQPVLVTVGRRSPVEEQAVCEILAGGLAGGRLQELPGGHMTPVSHAEPFNAAAAAWLAPA